jgi:eukaryotic-like serine/threonine-protein kinase
VHEGSTESELLIKMATQPAPALRTVAPSVSPEVCAIVDRALAFDLSRRYPTARAMREDIERVLGPNATPSAYPSVSIRADVSSAVRVDAPTMAAPASSQPPMAAPASSQATQAPIVMPAPPQSAATSAQAGSSPPFLLIAVIGSFVVAVGLAATFFVVRSKNSAEDARGSADDETSQKDEASGSSRTSATSSTTSKTTPSSTNRPVQNGKYRLLLKDGKYQFCVTSALKQAYPVRTDDEGVKVCNGTPEGPIPIDSLKAYHPSEFQWK